MPRRRSILRLRRWTAAVAVVALAGCVVVLVAGRQRPADAAVSPGTTERMSVDNTGRQATASSDSPAISATGRYVAFTSDTVLDPLDAYRGPYVSQSDVYVRDTATGRTALLSRGHEIAASSPPPIGLRAAAAPVETRADDGSWSPSISADGRFVAFLSRAGNIVDGNDNNAMVVIVCDRDPDGTGTLDTRFAYTLVATAYPATGRALRPSLSADATLLAFVGVWIESEAVRLATLRHGDHGALLPPSAADITPVFPPGTVQGVNGDYGLRASDSPALSADGSHLVFAARYSQTYTVPSILAVFDQEVATDEFTRLDLDGDGNPIGIGRQDGQNSEPTVSGDGRLVAFTTTVQGSTVANVRVVDRDPDGDGRFGPGGGESTRSEIVSLDRTGTAVSGGFPAFSTDGRYLAFVTDATNVHNGVDDADRTVSCFHPVEITGPGLDLPLDVAPLTRPPADRAPVNRASVNRAPVNRAPVKVAPAASGSPGSDLTGISSCDVIVRDLVVDRQRAAAGQPRLPAELASPSRVSDCLAFVPGATCEGNGDSTEPVLDADGSAVAYTSGADDLVTGDSNAVPDVFERRFEPVPAAAPLDFGPVAVGDSLSMVVPVAHSGFGPLTITSVTVTGTDFTPSLPSTCTGVVLHEGDQCLVPVRFRPSATGARTGTVDIRWRGGGDASLPVRLSGTGVLPPSKPDFSVAPGTLDFGELPVTKDSPPRDLVVTNNGSGPLHVNTVAPFGDGATNFPTDYRITSQTCTAAPVPPGGTCRVTVVFRPLAIGARPAAVRFEDDSAVPSPHLVAVTGAGARPTLTAAPPLAKPGQVTQVTGVAFPPNQTVLLALDGMPGTTAVVTDASGRFTRALLVLPHTYPGPQLLRATASVTAGVPAPVTVAATTNYLVVPGSLQPPDFTVRN